MTSKKSSTKVRTVNSSWISAIAYTPIGNKKGLLGVYMVNGDLYIYKDVPSNLPGRFFSHLKHSRSVGQSYNRLIKGRYDSKRERVK